MVEVVLHAIPTLDWDSTRQTGREVGDVAVAAEIVFVVAGDQKEREGRAHAVGDEAATTRTSGAFK